MPLPLTLRYAWLVALFSIACSGSGSSASSGGQTGGETEVTPCDTLDELKMTLDPSAVSALGFSANQVLATVGQLRDLPFRYQAGGETRLTVAPTYVGPTQYGGTCKDLQLGMSLGFVTSDGVFDETLALTLIATRIDSASGNARLERSAIHGSFGAINAQTTQLIFGLGLSAGTAHGSVVEIPANARSGSLVASF